VSIRDERYEDPGASGTGHVRSVGGRLARLFVHCLLSGCRFIVCFVFTTYGYLIVFDLAVYWLRLSWLSFAVYG